MPLFDENYDQYYDDLWMQDIEDGYYDEDDDWDDYDDWEEYEGDYWDN